MATLGGDRLGTHGAFFSHDGKRLAAAGGSVYDTVKLWDTESWQDVLTLSGLGSSNTSIAISGDGNVIGSQSGTGYLQVWQAPTWQDRGWREGADWARCLAITVSIVRLGIRSEIAFDAAPPRGL